MQCLRLLPVLLLLIAAIMLAGCTQGTGDKVATPPAVPSGSSDLSALTLVPGDVPQNYTLIESRAKKIADVGDLARELGYQDGYVTRFASSGENSSATTEIVQSIAVYPTKNISSLLALVEKQDRSDSDLNYTTLSGPGGDTGWGFYGKAPASVLVKPTNQNPLSSGPASHDVQVLYPKDTAELVFSRGSVFEVIRMTGPETDPVVLQEIAASAYRKLP
jgi:hypothetical protein